MNDIVLNKAEKSRVDAYKAFSEYARIEIMRACGKGLCFIDIYYYDDAFRDLLTDALIADGYIIQTIENDHIMKIRW